MSSLIRRYLPHLIIGLSISAIMTGAYLAVAFAARNAPKAIWSENPVTISFTAGNIGSSGSVGESFKCTPDTQGVSLKTSVSNPTRISLTTDFAPNGPCGPHFNRVTITAHCLVPAANCGGKYSGSVTVIKGYSFLPPGLSVTVVVCSEHADHGQGNNNQQNECGSSQMM